MTTDEQHTDLAEPAAVYANLRRLGQVSLGDPDDQVVAKVRRMAVKDGLRFTRSTTYPPDTRSRRYRTVHIALLAEDGQSLVFPDAKPS